MANNIEHAEIMQTELDKAFVEQSTSGWMELNDKLVKYNGGSEVKIPEIETDGLGDYDRNKGFPNGSVSFKWKTYEMTQDRSNLFLFDEHEVDETNFLLTAPLVMGEFQREHVIPEVDAYRYSKLGALAIEKGKVIVGGSPINMAVAIEKLSCEVREGDNDLYYKLELKEYRRLNVPTQQHSNVRQDNGLLDRPDISEKPMRHIVRSTDETFWYIACKYYGDGTKWKAIADANGRELAYDVFIGDSLVLP